ncbi:MAG TPA: hypothetical protein VEU28_05905 [Actinomycetota bacterium]|nr:hypothetical protein [Actinomycetota bacterium]
MREQAVVGLIALGALIWMVRPLLERRRALRGPEEDRRTADLLEEKQSVYRSILDLELDHEMGKMGSQDYLQLRQQSKSEALGIIRELEGSSGDENEQDTLEEEIRAARARLRKK